MRTVAAAGLVAVAALSTGADAFVPSLSTTTTTTSSSSAQTTAVTRSIAGPATCAQTSCRTAPQAIASSSSESGRSWAAPRARNSPVVMHMAAVETYTSKVTPAANSSVTIDINVPGTLTKSAFSKTLRKFGKGSQIPGFDKGTRIPDSVLLSYVGKDEVKAKCMEDISEGAIREAIEETGLRVIGQADLLDTPEELIQRMEPGEPLRISVKVDVWPELKFIGEYTGFEIEVDEAQYDEARYNAAMASLKERAIKLEDTEDDYAAQLGDSAIVDMIPYIANPDGSKGDLLPELASGDEVEIVLEEGRYMPGLAEGLVGVKADETREVTCKFPEKMGRASSLEGVEAIFEVKVRTIKTRTIPKEDDDFAKAIREDLTFEKLQKEVIVAVQEEAGQGVDEERNRLLEIELAKVLDTEVPETLVVEQARQKFAIMMTEMKDQGTPDEEVKKMITKESFDKYVEIVRVSTTRQLKTSLAYAHIAEKEGLQPTPQEVDDQLELVRAEAKGAPLDEAAVKDKIEATIQRNNVLSWIAQNSTVKVKSAPLPTPASSEAEAEVKA